MLDFILSNIVYFSIGILVFFLCLIFVYNIFFKKEDTSFLFISEELYNKELKHLDDIISNWVKDELERSSLIIDTSGYNQCFLGQISTINFKSVGINPEVWKLLDKNLKDTKDCYSFSHFLDLYRLVILNIDVLVLKKYTYLYFKSLTSLGPNVYTHTNTQIKFIMEKYPWLWLLERISENSFVKSYMISNSDKVVKTDLSDAFSRGIVIPQEDGIIS